VFHEDGDDDVDEDELRHQNENDEEDWSDNWTDATVVHTVVRVVAVVAQRVLTALYNVIIASLVSYQFIKVIKVTALAFALRVNSMKSSLHVYISIYFFLYYRCFDKLLFTIKWYKIKIMK